ADTTDDGVSGRLPMKASVATLLAGLVAASASADPLTCSLTGYKATPGLTAVVSDNALAVTWEGEKGTELRLRLGIDGGTPTLHEIAVRKNGGRWSTLATNVTPEFRVVSCMRRMTQQQLRPDSIEALGGKVSAKVWELFKKDDSTWID